MEIYVCSYSNPDELAMLPVTPDVPRCDECGKPSRLLFWESIETRKSWESQDAEFVEATEHRREQVDHSSEPM